MLVGAVVAIATCTACIILAYYLNEKGFFKERYSLYTEMASGQGIRKGTKVQIHGVDIGSVNDVSLTNNGLVRVKLELDARYQTLITDSSVINATRDQNIIADRVMDIDISKMGNRFLAHGEVLQSRRARDVESVLESVENILGRVGELVTVADSLLNMIADTSSTIGMLLRTKNMYNSLDSAVAKVNELAENADGLVAGMIGMFNTINDGVPKTMAFVDTFSISTMELMNKAYGIMGSLDTTMQNVGNIVNELGLVAGSAGNLITDGAQTINRTDDLVSGISRFWFIRNKVPRRDSIPLLGDAW